MNWVSLLRKKLSIDEKILSEYGDIFTNKEIIVFIKETYPKITDSKNNEAVAQVYRRLEGLNLSYYEKLDKGVLSDFNGERFVEDIIRFLEEPQELRRYLTKKTIGQVTKALLINRMIERVRNLKRNSHKRKKIQEDFQKYLDSVFNAIEVYTPKIYET
jgi:hypothetical protein